MSSYAFCLRNEMGDILHAEGATIDIITNTVADAKAILEACKHCKQSQHNQVIMQTGSMLLYKVLEGKWATPWVIADMVEEIKACLRNKQYKFQHILREGNQLADYFANIALDKGSCRYSQFKSIKTRGRKILNSDKYQCLYLRIAQNRG
uniref:Putative ovule protein n=1 Tax=Solanum chacoense TaxID=4108 RepID=A0A0V0HCS3_SOLCH